MQRNGRAAGGLALLAAALRVVWCSFGVRSSENAGSSHPACRPLQVRAAGSLSAQPRSRAAGSRASQELTRTRLPRAAWRRRSVPPRPPPAGAVAAPLLRTGRSGSPRRRAPAMRACCTAHLRHTSEPPGLRCCALSNARCFAGRALARLARLRCASSQVRTPAAFRVSPAQHTWDAPDAHVADIRFSRPQALRRPSASRRPWSAAARCPATRRALRDAALA